MSFLPLFSVAAGVLLLVYFLNLVQMYNKFLIYANFFRIFFAFFLHFYYFQHILALFHAKNHTQTAYLLRQTVQQINLKSHNYGNKVPAITPERSPDGTGEAASA